MGAEVAAGPGGLGFPVSTRAAAWIADRGMAAREFLEPVAHRIVEVVRSPAYQARVPGAGVKVRQPSIRWRAFGRCWTRGIVGERHGYTGRRTLAWGCRRRWRSWTS